jgi:anti-sigma regulatory factor (Ser/Thr protein kinase)
MPDTLCMSICADARAPGAAREAMRAVRGLSEQHRATGELLVSELVTNAVIHAGLSADEEVELRITANGRLRVEVSDRGGGDPAVADSVERDGGRGLLLVEALSSRWGMEGDDGTRAWFELDAPAADAAGDGGASARLARTA